MFDFLMKKTAPRGLIANIPYGRSKKGGGHDHRINRGSDRTPAQRNGDLKRTRNDNGK